MKKTITIIATQNEEIIELKAEIPQEDYEQVKQRIEDKKDFDTIQKIVTKNVSIGKLGNIYKTLDRLYKNMLEYRFEVVLN